MMTTSNEQLRAVEICAGAGGQGLGLEKAGFQHALAVEIDVHACQTLSRNRPGWPVAMGDVADPAVWDPRMYSNIDLLAGGVPCPPFSVAGKQLGAIDERDLFAWAVETAVITQPRALLLENVRGLSMPRFAAYRQHILNVLSAAGYTGQWRLLQASDFGVPQLRPRFVLVALRDEDVRYFSWPEKFGETKTVGTTLLELMGAGGWPHAKEWAERAQVAAPTIVGGSKKHGGADLGPTRAKRAWLDLAVDAMGIADSAPGKDWPRPTIRPPRLTVEMVARLQGWDEDDHWQFAGKKTSQYRQVGNAFPPPMAHAIGTAIADALHHKGHERQSEVQHAQDEVFNVLRAANHHLTQNDILQKIAAPTSPAELEAKIAHLRNDFYIDVRESPFGPTYKLGEFLGFVGQADHSRQAAFSSKTRRARIS